MNTNIYWDFQICIRVPLKDFSALWSKKYLVKEWVQALAKIYKSQNTCAGTRERGDNFIKNFENVSKSTYEKNVTNSPSLM